MALVFVSYRTDDAAHPASAVYERLSQLFGAEQIFRDARSLVPGEHSPSRIRAAVRTADALVAVIGPTWLDHQDNGERALDRPDDWVRWEIATALERGIPVLPVFVDDTRRPPKDRLPVDLHGLRRRQAHWVRHRTLGPDIDALGTALAELVPTLLLDDLLAQPPQLSDNPLPSALLRPEYGIVPFEGRRHELDDLLAWCLAPAPVSAHLVTAPAGEGKTRLAGELAGELRKQRWLTGVLLEDAPPERIADLTRLGRPVLLVIDYVEGRVEQLRALTERVVADSGTHPPVRLLLLGRSAGDWLAQAREAADDTVHELFVNAGRLPLGPLVPTADRHAEFTRAVQAFAGYLDRVTDDVVGPTDLADSRYGRALDVHAAALACLLDQNETGMGEQAVLDPVARVLNHEQRYWRRSAASIGDGEATVALIGDVVALATLFGARTREHARDLLGHWIADRSRLTRVLEWMAQLYPGSDALNPLRPDRLGEDHVAARLGREPDLATDNDIHRTDEQITRALTVLGRAAPRHDALGDTIARLVNNNRRTRVPMAMTVATQIEDPAPLVLAIETSLTDADDSLVDLTVEHLPDSSAALGRFGVHTLVRAIRVHERLTPPNRAELARLNLRLGNAHRALSQPTEALDPISTAVTSFTALAADDPDTYQPFEAQALNGLALTLRDLGRYTEALDVVEQALDRYASLAAGGTAAYRKIMADTMDTRAVCLHELQRDEEALAVAADTLTVRRGIAEDHPALYLGDYGAALNNAALRHREAGERQDSVELAARAVDVYRQLATDRPDAFRREHAIALSTLALTRSDVGDREGALTAITRCAELFDQLAALDPQAHLPNLATITSMRAVRLGNTGRHAEALTAAEDAVRYYDQLVVTRPAVFRPHLAMALNSLANRKLALDRPEDALTDAQRAVDLSRQPSADGIVERGDLAVALNTTGMALFRLDRLAEATDVLTECVDVRRELATRRPAAYTPDLAGTIRNLGRVHAAADRPDEARPLFDEAVDIFTELATAEPRPFAPPLVDTLLDLAELPADPADAVSALGAAWVVAAPTADASVVERINDRLTRLTDEHGAAVTAEWARLDLPPLPTAGS